MVDYIWNISFYPCILRPLWASSEYCHFGLLPCGIAISFGGSIFTEIPQAMSIMAFCIGYFNTVIVEKIAIYLFGAYLYNLSPINVLGVMEAIKSNASYTNFIKNQSAQNLINLSYLNWTYILCSIAISVLVILLLNQTKQKSNKG